MDKDQTDQTEEAPAPEETHRRGEYAKKKGEVILREHEYDGIQEFDQKLPNWWLFTLYIAIAWAGVHWFLHYHTGALKTDAQRMAEWKENLVAAEAAEEEKVLSQLDDTTLVTVWAKDPEIIASGAQTYATTCVGCHAADLSATMGGAALPGLPLDDGEWKYSARPLDIYQLIKDGTPPESPGYNGAKMAPWGPLLGPKKVAEVTAYIISKNPDDFK